MPEASWNPPGPLAIRLRRSAGPALHVRARKLADAWGESEIVLDDASPGAGARSYYIDAGRLAARAALRRGTRFGVDIGDSVGDLIRLRTRSLASWVAAVEADRLIRSRASVIVHRGPAHAYGLVDGVNETTKLVFLPDFPTLDLGSLPLAPRSDRFTLGFIGSSHARPGHEPAGTQLVDWVRQRKDTAATFLIAGTGTSALRDRAARAGVLDRVRFFSDFDRAAEVLADVDGFYLPQSLNRIGHARTTGKLADYLTAGRPVFSNPVGAALGVLPPAMLLDAAALRGPDQVRALTAVVDRWRALTPERQVLECRTMWSASHTIDASMRVEFWRDAVARRLFPEGRRG